MPKKMAVRNKDNKRVNKPISLPFTSSGLLAKKVFHLMIFFLVLAIGIVLFQMTKKLIVEQWEVSQISINDNLIQVTPLEIAKIMKREEYSYLLNIDIKNLQDEIKKIPWVKQVELRKKWPNTLEIKIEEHQAVAWFNNELLVSSGKLVEKTSENEKLALPIVEINAQSFLGDTRNDEPGAKQQNQYLRIVEEYLFIQKKMLEMGIKIDTLNISENLTWTFTSGNDLKIIVGRKRKFERIEQLNNVISSIKDIENIGIIDLRYSNGFAVTKKIKDQSLSS
ncbi:MAG: cell division protein FtsQ/DivIB [Kangiellaceae bacterium]